MQIISATSHGQSPGFNQSIFARREGRGRLLHYISCNVSVWGAIHSHIRFDIERTHNLLAMRVWQANSLVDNEIGIWTKSKRDKVKLIARASSKHRGVGSKGAGSHNIIAREPWSEIAKYYCWLVCVVLGVLIVMVDGEGMVVTQSEELIVG